MTRTLTVKEQLKIAAEEGDRPPGTRLYAIRAVDEYYSSRCSLARTIG